MNHGARNHGCFSTLGFGRVATVHCSNMCSRIARAASTASYTGRLQTWCCTFCPLGSRAVIVTLLTLLLTKMTLLTVLLTKSNVNNMQVRTTKSLFFSMSGAHEHPRYSTPQSLHFAHHPLHKPVSRILLEMDQHGDFDVFVDFLTLGNIGCLEC